MPTHKQRILMAMRGELPDMLPYMPRIDLWYNANSVAGTLPERHKGRSLDEICRAEGWPLHKIIPEYLNVRRAEDTLHRAISVLSLKETVYDYRFSGDIEIAVTREGDRTRVEYRTPVGTASTTTIYTQEMREAGASIVWTEEPIIKEPGDYPVVAYLFEHLELTPDYDDFLNWQKGIGDDGVAVTMGVRAASPIHHIQKDLIDATAFYYHYSDNPKEIHALAESVAHFFDQVLDIVADSPAEAVMWGANFDDMITYPVLFEKEIMPWIRKVADTLGARGKIVICHTDGENQGLMDLIRDSGMHVADAVTPAPMTKVSIEEYYQRWSDRLTIIGGIPECLFLEESTTDEEFEAFLDHFFEVVVPGKRLIVGIGDTVPAHAVFDRVVRVGERVEKLGRLPLEGGAARPFSEERLSEAAERVSPELPKDKVLKAIQEDVLTGRHLEIQTHVQDLLNKGIGPNEILQRGMIAAMEVISERFKVGDVFIPEVLLSARAMDEALKVLEPYLASTEKEASGKILIGTVRGDMHDIGKNMVTTMLKGVGFEIRDLGTNLPVDTVIEAVESYQPDILGLSALLTTTMSEMKKVIDALSAHGLRDRVKVMVGGAPVNEKFARDIGADGYAADAGQAVDLAKRLMEGHAA